MRDKHGRFVSPRGIELMWQTVGDTPTVTVENYMKWYNIFIINPDETVVAVDPALIKELSDVAGFPLQVDHTFHPKLLLLIAERIGGEVPYTTLEIVAGRWVIERELDENIAYHLPSYYES